MKTIKQMIQNIITPAPKIIKVTPERVYLYPQPKQTDDRKAYYNRIMLATKNQWKLPVIIGSAVDTHKFPCVE